MSHSLCIVTVLDSYNTDTMVKVFQIINKIILVHITRNHSNIDSRSLTLLYFLVNSVLKSKTVLKAEDSNHSEVLLDVLHVR